MQRRLLTSLVKELCNGVIVFALCTQLYSCAEDKSVAPKPLPTDLLVTPAASPADAASGKAPEVISSGQNGPGSEVPDLKGLPQIPGHSGGNATPTSGFIAKLDKVTAATEQEVVAFLRTNCKGCHGPASSATSFWTIDFENLNKDVIRTDADAHVAFQAMVNSSEGFEKPKAMPLGVKIANDKQLETSLLKVLKWYVNDVPEVATNAYLEYKLVNPFGDDVSITFDYQCKAPVPFRTYLARFTFDAFGRFPKQSDYDAFPTFGQNAVTTREMREAVAARLLSDSGWRNEFLQNGFKNFALKLSGANDILPSTNPSEIKYSNSSDIFTKAGLTATEASGLKEEFYQTLLANIDKGTGAESKKYADVLLGNDIAVSEDTKLLYGCGVDTSDGWALCDMNSANKRRTSYFSSIGYLAAKPTSMLTDNNNYGRTAVLYFFIRGLSLKAATNGPTGGAINPLPSCLKSADTRGHLAGTTFAPFGTLQIPLTGNVCQSCHIDRNLANGSILFRPFGVWGQVYKASDFVDPRANTIPGIASATDESTRLKDSPTSPDSKRVDPKFFSDLLNTDPAKTTEAACLVIDNKDVTLNNVGDLAKALIGDGLELARGLGRHIPRGVSNINATNSELIQEMEKAYEKGGGKLLPLFQAYFASETFACGNQAE